MGKEIWSDRRTLRHFGNMPRGTSAVAGQECTRSVLQNDQQDKNSEQHGAGLRLCSSLHVGFTCSTQGGGPSHVFAAATQCFRSLISKATKLQALGSRV